jgi:hypothetical protein
MRLKMTSHSDNNKRSERRLSRFEPHQIQNEQHGVVTDLFWDGFHVFMRELYASENSLESQNN